MNFHHPIARAAVLVVLLLVTTTLVAHHSGVEFDNTKVVELNGTIKEFQF